MNIGIVGLLPEQVRFVQQEFPQHGLRFLDKDNESEAKTFVKGCDKVVMMTKFIGHSLQDHVPERKRVFVDGGMTKLKGVLQTLPTVVKVTTPPKPATPAKATSVTLVRNGKTITRGLETVDYSPLMTAAAGDEVRIIRPPSCSLAQFSKRLEVKRSNLKKLEGIVTATPVMGDGFARIKVKEIRTCETTPPDSQAPPAEEAASMQNDIAVQPIQHVTVESVAMFGGDARAAAFWQSVFVETMKQWPGAPVDMVAQRADEALAVYRSRLMGAVRSGMQ